MTDVICDITEDMRDEAFKALEYLNAVPPIGDMFYQARTTLEDVCLGKCVLQSKLVQAMQELDKAESMFSLESAMLSCDIPVKPELNALRDKANDQTVTDIG